MSRSEEEVMPNSQTRPSMTLGPGRMISTYFPSATESKGEGEPCRLEFWARRVSVLGLATLPHLLPGEEIYDIKAPVTIPIPWGIWLLQGILGIFGLYVLVRLFFWFLTPGPVRLPPPPPPPDPLEEALSSLDRLRQSPIWAEGQIKNICEALALILKAYLQEKFKLGIGPASTTSELLGDLRVKKIRVEWINKTQDLLEICDNIKFAKGKLGNLTMEALFEGIKKLILQGEWQR